MNKFILSAILCVCLVFQPSLFAQDAKGKTGIDSADRNPVELTVSGNRIQYQNAPIGKRIEVYSVVGQKMAEVEVKSPSGEYIINVPKGIYIIKLGETVRKVAIR